ncbi:glycosyltransferase [Vibrio sp. RC27]
MKIEALFSTCDDKVLNVLSLIESHVFDTVDVLIVHQTQNEKLIEDVQNQVIHYPNVRYLHQNFYGVTKSRNLAIEKSIGDTLLFLDDDVDIRDDFVEIVKNAYSSNPSLDAITFPISIKNSRKWTKSFENYSFIHNKFSILKVGTIEITVKRSAILKSGSRFPENLGAGALYPACDEPVFLSRLIDGSMKIGYSPTSFVSHEFDSSGRDIDSYNKIMSRKIAFGLMFGRYLGTFLFVIFSIKNIGRIKDVSWIYKCFK